MQWSADITEHAHVTEVKNPVHAENNQNYYSQIARHLDRVDKCFRFDLAIRIASALSPDHHFDGDDDGDDNDNEQEHDPDEETRNLSVYSTPTRKIIDYFHIAHALASDPSPRVPQPLRTFASSTTAIHLALKSSSSTTIADASESFGLPDLHDAIRGCLDHSSHGEPHDVTGQRPTSFRCALLTDKVQIWSKIRVQLRNWHDPGLVEPTQTLVISSPSQHYPHGCYDCVVISPTADSDWPTGGLNGMLYFILLGSASLIPLRNDRAFGSTSQTRISCAWDQHIFCIRTTLQSRLGNGSHIRFTLPQACSETGWLTHWGRGSCSSHLFTCTDYPTFQ
jgi:hypothetical protein